MTTGPGPPYPPYPPPPPPPPPPRRISVAMVFVGVPVYAILNTVVGFAALIAGSDRGSANPILAAAAVLLALIAFGAGGALLAVKSPHAKGIGLGLMIGWALTSVVSVGFCTGLNPTLYTS